MTSEPSPRWRPSTCESGQRRCARVSLTMTTRGAVGPSPSVNDRPATSGMRMVSKYPDPTLAKSTGNLSGVRIATFGPNVTEVDRSGQRKMARERRRAHPREARDPLARSTPERLGVVHSVAKEVWGERDDGRALQDRTPLRPVWYRAGSAMRLRRRRAGRPRQRPAPPRASHAGHAICAWRPRRRGRGAALRGRNGSASTAGNRAKTMALSTAAAKAKHSTRMSSDGASTSSSGQLTAVVAGRPTRPSTALDARAQQEPEPSSCQGEEKAFEQELADQLPPFRSDGEARRHLAPSAERAGQEEACDIGGGEQEAGREYAHHQQGARPDRAIDSRREADFVCRHRGERAPGVARGVLVGELEGQGADFCPGLLHRCVRAQATSDPYPALGAIGGTLESWRHTSETDGYAGRERDSGMDWQPEIRRETAGDSGLRKARGATPTTVNTRPFRRTSRPITSGEPAKCRSHPSWLRIATGLGEPGRSSNGLNARPRAGTTPSMAK